jgi:HEAT repeat protein
LNDREPEVQQAAMLALKGSLDARVSTALVPLLHHGNAGTRGQAAQMLESLGWRSANRHDEMWFQVARGKFSRAASFGAACIPALETVLDSGPSSLSVAAVQALGQIEDENVLRPLFRALKSADPSVCVAAVGALAKMDRPEAIEPLIAGLRHRSTQVRLASVEALGVLRATAAVEHMRPLLRDSHWDVRRAAAEALGRLKDARAVEALADRLYDGDADVREAVILWARSVTGGAIGPLVLAAGDANSGVRHRRDALSRIDSH